MSATFTSLGLVVVFVLLQLAGVLTLPWWVWVILAAAVLSGIVADRVRGRQ